MTYLVGVRLKDGKKQIYRILNAEDYQSAYDAVKEQAVSANPILVLVKG